MSWMRWRKVKRKLDMGLDLTFLDKAYFWTVLPHVVRNGLPLPSGKMQQQNWPEDKVPFILARMPKDQIFLPTYPQDAHEKIEDKFFTQCSFDLVKQSMIDGDLRDDHRIFMMGWSQGRRA